VAKGDPSKIVKPVIKGIEKKIKDKKEEEEKKGIETPRGGSKPNKVIAGMEKAVAGKVEKIGGKKGKDDDNDDPIA